MDSQTATVSLSGGMVALLTAAFAAAGVLADSIKAFIASKLPDRRTRDDECTEAVHRLESKLEEIGRDVAILKDRGK